MALKQANTLAPANVSASGFALGDARHIGGHKVVASLTALYALYDWQLLNPGETDTSLALGQDWYVKGVGRYRLTNWANRKSASGWTKVVDSNSIDTTLFQIVTALPTSGINKNRIYLVKSSTNESKNIYSEYLYTGDTSATYDASKWEKLGEYQPKIDTTLYDSLVAQESKGKLANVALFDAFSMMAPPSIESSTATGDVTVYFTATTNRFYAKSGTKYYNNWAWAYKLGAMDSKGRIPEKEKVYIMGGKAYAWNGTAMVLIGNNDKATASADGLMSKEDKTALDADHSYVTSAKNSNKELVSPEVSGTWTVFKNDSTTQASTSTGKTLDVENGFVVTWAGTYKWTEAEGKKNPTAVSGNWTTLTASGTASASYRTPSPVSTDTTISATLSAPKTGLMVSGNSVVLASGNDTKTDSVKVTFKHRRYWGLVSSSSVTADAVKGLSGTDLNNSRTAKLTGISATDSQYYVIAYPKAMGELTKIVQNGATPLLSGGFVKSEVTVVNGAGASIPYLVYRTEKPGALKDNSYLEIA